MNLLAMTNISKRFGAVTVLQDVSFDLQAGEVHALVGENGAGKSTLMKILAGVQPHDGGSMTLAGEAVNFNSVTDAREHGVVMVYQELALVPSLSVAENLFLGDLSLLVNYRKLYTTARDLLAEVDLDVDPKTELSQLSIGEQQLVEIAKALAREGRILVLDEPTAALSAAETERLFELIAKVKATGVSMVYISHRLEEVFRIADRVTVLRDGKYIGTRSIQTTTPTEIVQLMVGRDVKHTQHVSQLEPDQLAEINVQHEELEPLTITLQTGEVVGLAGVIGSGRERVLPMLFGLEGSAHIRKLSQPSAAITSPRQAIQMGLVLVPSDRKVQGLVQALMVRENISLATLTRLQHWGFMQATKEREQTDYWINRLSLRPADPSKNVSDLSGGNQQKVVIAKALATQPDILLLDEPTRGVDVGARAELYNVIEDFVAQGLGMIVASSDTEELITLADRILVFREGRVSATLRAPFRYEEVVAHVTGATRA
ncbi:MAG: sugar ABC transporter ATP-binding protein [Deinococcota bacterium]